MTRPLFTFYGDDLTGSTDAMEALASHGVRTVLFTRRPEPQELVRFGDYQAIGLAGASRSETPSWMEQHLRPEFSWLRSLDAAMCHYKVCSTFDSSPETGSIGMAIEIGQSVFGQKITPLIAGVPQLKRYTAFGHLFAAYRGEIFRIDRHPVMSRHPVTPMSESDLRLHLGRQTTLPVRVAGLDIMQSSDSSAAIDRLLGAGDGILLFDVIDVATQITAGREVWRTHTVTGPFVVGSSGVEYALIRAWIEQGLIDGHAAFTSPGPADRIAVVSGSVSPTTARQIENGLASGFDGIALDPLKLMTADTKDEIGRAVREGLARLASGRSVILYTAQGPATDRGGDIMSGGGSRHAIGRALGQILQTLVQQAGLTRAVIAGGDTSSHALGELGIVALTTCHPLPKTPGSPLCTAFSNDPQFNGLQIALKGGQLGGDDYFAAIRDGRMTG